jgi:alpha-tubulin suppressor-like RCC1 family protein
MVLTKLGEVYTWGSNEGGQLGLDSKYAQADCVKKPTLVEALVRSGIFVTQIACGETHSIVLAKDSKVYGWGMSMYGQLGLGFSADSFEPGVGLSKSKVLLPVEITPYLPPNVKIVQVFCGAAFTLLKTKDGELYGCGINDLG